MREIIKLVAECDSNKTSAGGKRKLSISSQKVCSIPKKNSAETSNPDENGTTEFEASNQTLQETTFSPGSVFGATAGNTFKLSQGNQVVGTHAIKFIPPTESEPEQIINGVQQNLIKSVQYLTITCMKENENKSLEELSFEAPEMKMGKVQVNAAYVKSRLDEISKDEDLSKYIL